jgi:hypothetical protein
LACIEWFIVINQDGHCTHSHSVFILQASLVPCPDARKVGFGRSRQKVGMSLPTRTPVLDCPPSQLRCPDTSSARAGVYIPRAAMLPRPLQHLPVPPALIPRTLPLIPRTLHAASTWHVFTSDLLPHHGTCAPFQSKNSPESAAPRPATTSRIPRTLSGACSGARAVPPRKARFRVCGLEFRV